MVDGLWGFRRLRWRDCEGALIGLRRVDEEHADVLVGSGVHQGKRETWSRSEGRIWTVPDWVWEQVAVGGGLIGEVIGRGLIRGGMPEAQRLQAITDGLPVEPWEEDAPLVFSGAGNATQLAERDRSATGRMAAMVAAWGWMVFPLPPSTKIPFGGSHGYKDAVSGVPTAVFEHYRTWPDDNVALATGQGATTPVVIDIDPRNGGSIELAEKVLGCPLAWTLTATSPSGGWHLYFTDPHQDDDEKRLLPVNSGGFPSAPGVEIKARGRHVVMPPSTFGEGAYRFVQDPTQVPPGLLPEEVRAKAQTAQHRTNAVQRPPGVLSDFDIALDWFLDIVRASATNGMGRNNVVHDVARTVVLVCQDRDDFLSSLSQVKSVALETDLPENEVNKAIRSAVHTWRPKAERWLEAIL